MPLRVGLIVNPIAGIGGPAALKGSDGEAVQALARERGAQPRAGLRTITALEHCRGAAAKLSLKTWADAMGATWIAAAGMTAEVLGRPDTPSTAADTLRAANTIIASGVDVLAFAGGDGTARDLIAAVPPSLPIVGIPAGVKMHSGVFATSPRAAGELISMLANGDLVAATTAEVRDVDEEALREGRVATRFFGELAVPRVGHYLQHVKSGGREVEALVVEEIVQHVVEEIAHEGGTYLLGPGSTVNAIKDRLGMHGTVLGFDAWEEGAQTLEDADEETLARWMTPSVTVVLSFSRGQGFLLGRGNQQLSPRVLAQVPRERLRVVGSRSKLATLQGRPLLVDTGSAEADRRFTGIVEIVTGYEDCCFHRVSAAYDP